MNFIENKNSYTDIMTIAEFFECERLGIFIPDDGTGYYGTQTHYTCDVSLWQHLPPECATHVHWFNK